MFSINAPKSASSVVAEIVYSYNRNSAKIVYFDNQNSAKIVYFDNQNSAKIGYSDKRFFENSLVF